MYTIEKRVAEYKTMIKKYPEKIPIVCEKYKGYSVPDLYHFKYFCNTNRYLVPNDLTSDKFMLVVRKQIQLPKDQALFLFVNGKETLKSGTLMLEVYESKKDTDGFLYIAYSTENVLG